jgi:hypothetical protein
VKERRRNATDVEVSGSVHRWTSACITGPNAVIGRASATLRLIGTEVDVTSASNGNLEHRTNAFHKHHLEQSCQQNALRDTGASNLHRRCRIGQQRASASITQRLACGRQDEVPHRIRVNVDGPAKDASVRRQHGALAAGS